MLHWSTPCQVSPEDVLPHPKQIRMLSFRQFDDNPLFIVPIDEKGVVQRDFFYCRICRKWLSISTSTGNINKHIIRKHPDLVQHSTPNDEERISAAKRLILLNCLPFSLCDDPDFRILCPGIERHSLSNYASHLSEFIISEIKEYMQNAIAVILSIDEWSSQTNQPYLGIVAHCLFENTYENFTLDHIVLKNKHNPSEIVAYTIAEAIEEFSIQESYIGFVSDTTAKMPAANAILNTMIDSNWYPCYCHIFDLLLNRLLEYADPQLKLMFTIQKKIGNSHAFHNFLKSANASYSSIPTFSKTRWFSIYHTMRNFIELKDLITEFILSENIKFDDENPFTPEIFETVTEFIEVIATARTCIKELESDSFGTISMVLPAIRLFQKSIDDLPSSRWEETKTQFYEDFSQYSHSFFEGEKLKNLVIATRLNPIFTNELTKDEILNADAFLREAIHEAPAIGSQTLTSPERYGLSLFSQPETEVDQVTKYSYLASSLKDCSINLDEFWFAHTEEWPELSELALKTLLPPASSAACERQFSLASRIDAKRRARLAEEKVRDLVIIAGNRQAAEAFIE